MWNYEDIVYTEWSKSFIGGGTMDDSGRLRPNDKPKVRWVKGVAVAEDEEDCSGDFDWPDSWLPAA